jgi:hypothetical protein
MKSRIIIKTFQSTIYLDAKIKNTTKINIQSGTINNKPF